MPRTKTLGFKGGLAVLLFALLAAGFIWQKRPQDPAGPMARKVRATTAAAPSEDHREAASRPLTSAAPLGGGETAPEAQRRIELLETRLVEEAARRAEMQQRIEDLAAEVAELRGAGPSEATADSAAAAAAQPKVDYTKSPMQRALEAAGLDQSVAEEIKLRGDQLAMSEMYLRDQATREGWLDTPRFKEEMAEIEAQRVSIRDEIGDDAYDRYLFELGHTNRVIVNDVMLDSVAEDVGLREGDLILNYGGARIFAPDDLIESTHGGSSGEPILLELMRNGERMQIEVPRGPLGLRIGPAQDDPDAG